ncbi:trigger factor, partial [Afipia felis]|uniref:trigger factor n=1 Tax=Afipia felis TaxID=1035 RepID=UPI00065FA8BC
MQVNETLSEGLKHEFQISIPAAEIDAKVNERLAGMKDKVRINGFRPGKVPVAHLKKVYGKSVAAETLEETIRETNQKIFTDRGFRLANEAKVTMPTDQAEIEGILDGKKDLNYSVAIEVVPPIALADFKTFKVEKQVAEVTDADLNDALKRVADQSRPYAAKAEGAKAEKDDR